jgi:hypothetical protein
MIEGTEAHHTGSASESNTQPDAQRITPYTSQGTLQGPGRPKITLTEYRQRRNFLRQLISVKHYAEHTLAGYDLVVQLTKDQDCYQLLLNVTFKLLPELAEIISDLPNTMVK